MISDGSGAEEQLALITNYFSRPALYFFRVWKVRRWPVLGTDTL